MSLLNLLQQAQSGGGLGALGQALGMDERTTQSLAEQLAPAISGGVRRRAQAEGGLASVLGALRGEQAAGYFQNPAQAAAPQARQQGEDFLAQIFGQREAAPQIAREAASRAGASPEQAEQLMPALAAMLQGGMQRQAPDREIDMAMSGPLGQMGDRSGAGLSDLLGALGQQGAQGGGGIGGLLGGAMKALGGGGQQAQGAGAGGLAPLLQMLDADGDGSPVDDILERFMK